MLAMGWAPPKAGPGRRVKPHPFPTEAAAAAMPAVIHSRFLKPVSLPPFWTIRNFYSESSPSSSIRNSSSSPPHKALQVYCQRHRQSQPFDSFSVLFVVKSCAHLRNLPLLGHLHAHLLKLGFNSHVYVATCLLHAYSLVSLHGACIMFDEMPDKNVVTWNTMITAYSKYGNVGKARLVFEQMPSRNLASWSAMVAGYMYVSEWGRGLELFREMVASEGLRPDNVALGSVLSGCARMGSLGLLVGRSVHGFMAKNGWGLSVDLGTVLVDMYAKGGFLKTALRVFDLMPEKNVASWTALICGSAQHGYAKEAFYMFGLMQDLGVKPNEMTFTGILSACARAGLVEEGRKYFNMIEEYGFEPKIHHYGCMVDLFGKAGRLEKAYEIIKSMKIEPNVYLWSSLLSSCKVHKQFEIAQKVIEQVLRTVKPQSDGGVYTLISDLFALNEKWDEAERVRKLMINQKVRKARGSSFIRSGSF